jgi:hypothetical protein
MTLYRGRVLLDPIVPWLSWSNYNEAKQADSVPCRLRDEELATWVSLAEVLVP